MQGIDRWQRMRAGQAQSAQTEAFIFGLSLLVISAASILLIILVD